MKRITKRIISYLFFALILVSAPSSSSLSWALEDLAVVKPMMDYGQVLKILGAPQEKTVMEIKREELWSYAEQVVVFKEGKVSKIIHKDGEKHPELKKPITKKKEIKAKIENAEEADMILKDLAEAR